MMCQTFLLRERESGGELGQLWVPIDWQADPIPHSARKRSLSCKTFKKYIKSRNTHMWHSVPEISRCVANHICVSCSSLVLPRSEPKWIEVVTCTDFVTLRPFEVNRSELGDPRLCINQSDCLLSWGLQDDFVRIGRYVVFQSRESERIWEPSLQLTVFSSSMRTGWSKRSWNTARCVVPAWCMWCRELRRKKFSEENWFPSSKTARLYTCEGDIWFLSPRPYIIK